MSKTYHIKEGANSTENTPPKIKRWTIKIECFSNAITTIERAKMIEHENGLYVLYDDIKPLLKLERF